MTRSSYLALFWVGALIIGCEPPVPSITVGAAPNDAIIVEGAKGATLVVVASMDSAIQFFDISNETKALPKVESARIFFKPTAAGISPNPWSVAATSDGQFLVATLYGGNSVALIDMNSRQLLSVTKPDGPDFNHPTTVKIFGRQALVLFPNFQKWDYKAGAPAQYGPGKLARFIIEDAQLKLVDSIDLPCINPSDISFDVLQRPIVACSGTLKMNAKNDMELASGAAVVRFKALAPTATTVLEVESSLALGQFSPAKLITHESGYFLSSSVKRQILFLPSDATVESQATLIPLNPDLPDDSGYLPSLIKWNNDLAFVADYKNDQLIALQLGERRLLPAPFPKPLQLRNKANPLIFKGPQAIAQRQSQSGSYSGPDFYVMMALSSEIIPVTLSEVAQK